MNTTKNLGLKKPEPTDFYDVQDFNDNADKLDEAIKELKQANTIVDDLSSTQADAALSANQGRVLNEKIESMVQQAAAPREVIFSEDGKTITETSEDTQVITEFVSDKVITQKHYTSGELEYIKTTTFSDDGLSVKEEITK